MLNRGFRAKKLKMLIILLFVGCLLITQNSLANSTKPPMFDWLNKVDVNLYPDMKMIQTEDGNTICIGGNSAVKFNTLGNKEWGKQFPYTNFLWFDFKDLCLTKDGGSVVLAVYSVSGANKVSLLKLDNAGNQLWGKTLVDNKTGENTVKLMKIQETRDGGFILGGATKPDNGISFLKTNAQGYLKWSYTYKKDKPQEITGLLQTNDGGYIIIGNSVTEYYNPPGPDGWGMGGVYKDGFILKVNKTGQKEWELVFNESPHTSVDCIQKTGDRGFIIGGGIAVNDYKYPAYLLKINEDGTIKWKKSFSSETSVNASYVRPTSDNGYLVLAGPIIIKVDPNGNTVWEKTTYGRNSSIIETPEGYLVVGTDPKRFTNYFTAYKLSWDTSTILQRDYSQLSDKAKVGYVLNLYDLQISSIKEYVKKFNNLKMTAKDKANIDLELSTFEKTTGKMLRDMESQGASGLLVEYLHRSPLIPVYRDLKLQYDILAEAQVDKHFYIPDELQKRYGNTNNVSGINMDGIIVTKVNSFYNLDLRNVKKYIISNSRIDIVTNNKTYFLRTDGAEKFPTYVGLGIKLGNFKYVFNTTGLKKPVANDWILVNDVIKYMVDQPKKKSLKYKDLVISKDKGQVYNIKIPRVYKGSNFSYFNTEFILNSNYTTITTKTPAVTYFISMAESSGSNINDSNAVVKLKDSTYKVKVLN